MWTKRQRIDKLNRQIQEFSWKDGEEEAAGLQLLGLQAERRELGKALIADLIVEYQAWAEPRDLFAVGDAEDALAFVRSNRFNIPDAMDKAAWLEDFIARWDAAMQEALS